MKGIHKAIPIADELRYVEGNVLAHALQMFLIEATPGLLTVSQANVYLEDSTLGLLMPCGKHDREAVHLTPQPLSADVGKMQPGSNPQYQARSAQLLNNANSLSMST